jgi:uncharacterized membrane protein
MKTYGSNFWAQALERAIKTAAQAGVLALGADAANKLPGIVDNPSIMLYALVGGALLSLLTSLATAPVGPKDDPSAVASEPEN